ncbi:AraC family transcriptional regulator [Nitrospirillum sp. BR 11752]|uniref:helix-turn-helix transcriptional regulator n=1 Tax=Nitrospirillum sp. BR 11752 TaxID=3104293 RepID=UPI002EC808C5|nr:AraC family transcriptional regulator [Nitrospirillum sp. BR 11752]
MGTIIGGPSLGDGYGILTPTPAEDLISRAKCLILRAMPTSFPDVTASRDLFDTISEAAVRAGLVSCNEVQVISGAYADGHAFARLSERALLRLWSLLALRYGGSDVGGILALQVPVHKLGLLGEIVNHAASPTEAFDQVVRFSRLLNQRARIGQKRTASHLTVVYGGSLQADTCQAGLDAGIIWSLAHLALLPGRLFGADVYPERATLPGAHLRDVAGLYRIFGRSIDLDAGQPGLCFAVAALRGLHKAPEARLLSHLEGAAALHVAALPPCELLGDRVRAFLEGNLAGGPPPLEEIAKHMGFSKRSLQRALNAEGASFAEILDDLRRARAKVLLADGRQSLSMITYLLGYTDQAILSRAARRWFGASPRNL